MVPASFPFVMAGREWWLVGGRALFCPAEQALLVADLHLEKASFHATHGQFLPPYDSRATLEALTRALEGTGARRVFCLGDNFHDEAGLARMEPHARGMLAALIRAVEWVWLVGNHDPALPAGLGGRVMSEAELGGTILRHQARPGELRPEISGHFHPRLQITLRGRRIRRPCAVLARQDAGAERLILPAFGALTGGMDAAAPAIRCALQPARQAHALLPAGGRLARVALWQQAA